MFAKAVAILAFAAAAQAGAPALGYYAPHVGAQAEQTIRGYGGLSTVSHQSKSVVSPHSHAQKFDTRVTNTALSAYAAPAYAHGAYAAPAYAHGAYAAPAYAHGASLGYAHGAVAHGYAAPALGYAHGAVAHGYAAPALAAAHHGYAAPAVGYGHTTVSHGYAAPAIAAAHHAYAAPAIAHHGYAAPAIAAHGLAAPVAAKAVLGTHYSAVSPAVASLSFSRTLDGYGTLSYGY